MAEPSEVTERGGPWVREVCELLDLPASERISVHAPRGGRHHAGPSALAGPAPQGGLVERSSTDPIACQRRR